jgi:DNA-binding MarR family transcriptional regulator
MPEASSPKNAMDSAPFLKQSPLFLLQAAAALVGSRYSETLTNETELDDSRYFWILCTADYDELSQQNVADILGINRNSMVAYIDTLEKREAIVRHRNPDNRREFILRVTAKGRRLCEQWQSLVEAHRIPSLSPLTESECDDLFRLLIKLLST